MHAILAAFGLWFASFVAKRLIKTFFSLGVAIITFDFVQSILNRFIQKGISSLGGLGSDFLAMVNIAKLDVCISIIVGALTLKIMLKSLNVQLVRSK